MSAYRGNDFFRPSNPKQRSIWERETRLHFLGRETQSGHSPTLWSDGDEYVIQGFTLDDEASREVGVVPDGEAVVRVPKILMNHLVKDCNGTGDV